MARTWPMAVRRVRRLKPDGDPLSRGAPVPPTAATGAGPASTVTCPGAAEVPALVLPAPPAAPGRDRRTARCRRPRPAPPRRRRAAPRAALSRPVHASSSTSSPGRGAAPGRWPSSGTCPWTWTAAAGPRSRRRRAARATPRPAAVPASPRSPCTRARCSRYSRPENGSPPGNRSGTYPLCGRPVTWPADGRDTPATTRSRVDLPDPFGPVTRISRPAGRSAETSRTTQGCRTP